MKIMSIIKNLSTYYGIFGVLHLINAEKYYSYTVPRRELEPFMDKLAKFSDCNSDCKTGTVNYDFFFTTDHSSSSCSPHRLLQKDFFIDLLQNAINSTVDFITSEQEETHHLSVKIVTDFKTSVLPELKEQETGSPNDEVNTSEVNTSEAPTESSATEITTTTLHSQYQSIDTEISTTLDPLQEKQMREKKEKNDFLATIITGVLVAMMLAMIIGCVCAHYAKTLKQSGDYVVNNP